MKRYIIIAIVVIVLAGAYFGYIQYIKAMNYCYNINAKKTKVNNIGIKSISIDFAIDFKNNSDLEANIDGYQFDILLNGIKVSGATSNTQVIMKPNSLTTIIIPININPESLLSKQLVNLKTLSDIVSNRSNVIIAVNGSVSGGVLGIKVKQLPIQLSYSLAELLTPNTTPKIKCQ